MPLLIFSYACSISCCAHLPQPEILLFYCFHISRNSPDGYFRAFVHLFKSVLLEWQLTQQFVFPSREHQMMPYPVEELGCIPPLEAQMAAESMPACAAGSWQSGWLTVWLAHFSFCGSASIDGYLPLFRQYGGEFKLSSILCHHCPVWFHRNCPDHFTGISWFICGSVDARSVNEPHKNV